MITTIQEPTHGVRAIAARASATRPVIVIGDEKSPDPWVCSGAQYFSMSAQVDLPFASATALPRHSYARKMLGYLIAATDGAEWIRETDDDNAPYENFFDDVPETIAARVPSSPDGWVNIYRYFTDRFVWPRGYPLSRLQGSGGDSATNGTHQVTGTFVLQAIADGDPDVDAVYRLTAPDTSDITFQRTEPLVMPTEAWTPFNSQATTWPRTLLPLMYLPSTCSFRMTDIWRSFIAQRLMRGLGAQLVVTSPTVYQDRNAHDLMRDFRDEIEGYVGYEIFVGILSETHIRGGAPNILDDLSTIYGSLISAGFFSSTEQSRLDAWITDMHILGFGSGQ